MSVMHNRKDLHLRDVIDWDLLIFSISKDAAQHAQGIIVTIFTTWTVITLDGSFQTLSEIQSVKVDTLECSP